MPLAWYRSGTFALLPGETHAQIKRAYCPSPPEEGQHAMRHFCGFCGTPLSYWSEDPPGEADFIQLTLGSLSSGDLADLEDLGLLPGSPAARSRSASPSPFGAGSEEEEAGADEEEVVEEQEEGEEEQGGNEDGERGGDVGTREKGAREAKRTGREMESSSLGSRPGYFGTVGALPWLDSLTEGSRLGRLRRARGQRTNRSGTVRVNWEVVEWTEEDGMNEALASPRGGKRKLGELEEAAAEAERMEGVLSGDL